jgi:hypothetical protein
MNKLMLLGLSHCFTDTEKPIMIFCKWEDALAIKETLISNIKETPCSVDFESKGKVFEINCFSCFINGKTFFFIDQNHTENFSEFITSYKQ